MPAPVRFGVILISRFHQPREGYRFGKLGFDLMERLEKPIEPDSFLDRVRRWLQPKG